VARLEFADRLTLDIERIATHLAAHDATDIDARLGDITDACAVLERHPLIGRQTADGLHELVIGRGSRGYVALYEFDAALDLVLVLAMKAQREESYPEN
jgi:plasmid stabilization system protein ParE